MAKPAPIAALFTTAFAASALFGIAASAQPVAGTVAPPAPPPSQSPPAPAQPPSASQPAPPLGPFIVFFNRDDGEITPQAAAILDNVAAAYRISNSALVIVAGNTDRAGSAEHNLQVARRRVESVQAYLVARDLPANAISMVSHGEARPLVETADGVREAQNRNVQIFFRPATASHDVAPTAQTP
jgi:outer membrane protein OmpA-like peptidoglycan-associated protein